VPAPPSALTCHFCGTPAAAAHAAQAGGMGLLASMRNGGADPSGMVPGERPKEKKQKPPKVGIVREAAGKK